jgi:hypothetical protein
MITSKSCHSGANIRLGHAAYDVSRRETFDSIGEIWMKEVEMYSTVSGAVKAIIGNKLDLVRPSPDTTSWNSPRLRRIFSHFYLEAS